MTPEDLATIHARAFVTPRPWSRAEFADLLASPHCFLIEEGPSFVLGRTIADEAELLTIATDPDHRRRGLARRCLTAFETTARSLGATTAFLEVAADNAPARALYLGNGWQISGERRDYYQTPDGRRINAQILGKSLA